MVVRIPANYRQSFKWLGGLDAVSGLMVGGGAIVAMKVLTGTASWPEKIPEILIAFGLGALFGLVKFPMSREGDRLTVWLRRGAIYLRRDRRGSMFVD